MDCLCVGEVIEAIDERGLLVIGLSGLFASDGVAGGDRVELIASGELTTAFERDGDGASVAGAGDAERGNGRYDSEEGVIGTPGTLDCLRSKNEGRGEFGRCCCCCCCWPSWIEMKR